MGAFLCICATVLAGFFAGRTAGFQQAMDRRNQLPNGSIHCKPGPWGELEYVPFTIAAPDDLLPVRSIEANGTHWVLKGYTPDRFVTFLQSTSLSAEQQQAFLAPAVLHIRPDGIELTPTPDLVLSTPDDLRDRLYPILAQFSENDAEISYLPRDSLDERFLASGVSPATMALFKRLCYRRGNAIMFSGVAAVLSRLPGYEEKLRFVKALTCERTMLLRLHVTQDSDLDALSEYWGKGCTSTDVHTILRSLSTIRNGTWMSILMVLPPLPTAEIYDYPTITDNPLNGPPVNRDCCWTSLNFFRNVPDPNFGKLEYVSSELKENYYPVPDNPRYGDVVLFGNPDGFVIHTAVFIADDICFTKNGSNVYHPWMLATMADLIDQYSIALPANERLTVAYFRNKRL